jgi:hypothetical protein
MYNIHRRATLLVTAVDELFGTHTLADHHLGRDHPVAAFPGARTGNPQRSAGA